MRLHGAVNEASLGRALQSQNIHSMATGQQGGQIKGYYIAERDGGGGIYLAEIIVDVASKNLSATLKSEQSDLAQFTKHIRAALSNL